MFVRKKDGSLRMYILYRNFKKVTIKNKYPISKIYDFFEKLQCSSYFSKIDLISGNHQFRVIDRKIAKTTFITWCGDYEFVVMSF